MKNTSFCLIGLALAGVVFTASPAFANGGDFFDELSAVSSGPAANIGPSYFGFVRDQRGKAIPRAMVTATIGAGENLTILADALGHYHIPGFDKSVDTKSIAIQCSKTGYRQTAVGRRAQKGGANAPIEIDCTLAPVTN